MKITTRKQAIEKVLQRKVPKHQKPLKPNFLLAIVIRILSFFDLWAVKFRYTKENMDKVGKKEPCLILMNHSSFIDMKAASGIFFPRRYAIVSTFDSFVGFPMAILMRLIGCIPTRKFVSDVTLIKDMENLLKKKKVSVLMYPEAGYSFDGKATTLPRKMGVLMKKLGVPVVTVITEGAFAVDPLYNCLQRRKVKVGAKVTCIASAEEVKSLTVAELDKRLDAAFSFDNFRWQQENRIKIDEPFRADGLHRILYRCPHCNTEGKMEGRGVTLTCHHCGVVYTLDEYGYLQAEGGIFNHVPDWYEWERKCVREELENGTYSLETAVDIGVLRDYSAFYQVGDGILRHDGEGFALSGCEGKLEYRQNPLASYTICADYYWYEKGDVISIGNSEMLYYCFPKDPAVSVSKVRLAAEELYKMKKEKRKGSLV